MPLNSSMGNLGNGLPKTFADGSRNAFSYMHRSTHHSVTVSIPGTGSGAGAELDTTLNSRTTPCVGSNKPSIELHRFAPSGTI